MITGYSASSIGPGAAIVGMAKDGHIIVGPYKAPGILWQPCDVDACNGAFFEDKDGGEGGIYMYAMTMFHPYTIGCWGPANRPRITASCSSKTRVCDVAEYKNVGFALILVFSIILAFI